MQRIRCPLRRLNRSTVRSTAHVAFRQRWRSPDDLAEMMTCFRRAIRAHRHLNRLAPRLFDSAVIDRERRQRGNRLAWMAECEVALEKVYGPSTPEERAARREEEERASRPPPLHPRTQAAVLREEENWHFWMAAGKLASARYQQRRPHDVPSLGRVARLLEIAFDFGRLSTGLDWRHPAPVEKPEWTPSDADADLCRAYGQCLSVEAEPSPASVKEALPCSKSSSSGAGEKPSPGKVDPPDGSDGPAVVAPAALPVQSRRRDAWSSWARHQRQLRP